ncbi:uncharacterized protein EHS24_004852 [Apiotrichum porosum]|uniref:Uncharacterized protein n=1 Tax=Apiotrichum porosum TaxID=105984 RepID=A0A427Y662_9TREE|nr:uncharacterized protein EHS24_004852 [Apiotrichum porosum]RSH86583.1 hypothetical protein EHS24_004852 [Apiotrichum porosum]
MSEYPATTINYPPWCPGNDRGMNAGKACTNRFFITFSSGNRCWYCRRIIC